MQLTGSARLLVGAFPATPQVVGNAVAVSETVIEKNLFTTATVFLLNAVIRESTLGKEEVTRDIPSVSPKVLENLDEHGIARVGTHVNRGDILVGKIVPKSQGELTPEERLQHEISGRAGENMRDDSLYYENLDPGLVVSVQLRARKKYQSSEIAKRPGLLFVDSFDLPRDVLLEVKVEVMVRRPLSVGDILEDDQGNKVLLAQIGLVGLKPELGLGYKDMWVHPDSTLASRLLESTLYNPDVNLKGRKKKQLRYQVGRLEFKKKTLRLEEKIQARGTGEYDLRTQMPMSSRFVGAGQLVKAETARALFQAGYRVNLMEMLTNKSDSLEGRKLAHDGIVTGGDVKLGVPETTYRLEAILRALCIVTELSEIVGDTPQPINLLDQGADPQKGLTLDFGGATTERIRGGGSYTDGNAQDAWPFEEVKKRETINFRTCQPEKDGLFCERIFGPEKDWECACGKYRGMKYKGRICDRCGVKITLSRVRRRRMGHIELAAPVVHFWFLTAGDGLTDLLEMSQEDVEKVVYCQDFIVTEPGKTDLTLKQLLNESEYVAAQAKYGPEAFKAEMGAEAVRQLLRKEKPTSINIDWIVLYTIPVLPPGLRPLSTYDLNTLYGEIINRNNHLKKLVDLNVPEVIIRNEKRMLQQTVDKLFDNARCHQPALRNSGTPLVSLTDELAKVVQQLDEKPTDYSACGIVIPDPSLEAGNAIGLPFAMVHELFTPWAISFLRARGNADTIKSAKKWIERESQSKEGMEVFRQVLVNHPVLVISDSQQFLGLQPKIVDGEAIRLHPDDARKLGITFGGEQVVLHLPLSQAAIDELSNPSHDPDTSSIFDELTPNRLVAHLVVMNYPRQLNAFDRVLLGIDKFSSPAAPIPYVAPLPPPPPLDLSAIPPELLNKQVSDLNPSIRSRKLFSRLGIKTLGELIQRSPADLLAGKNFGMSSLEEVQNKLKDLGLTLRADPSSSGETQGPVVAPQTDSGQQSPDSSASDGS